MLTLPVNWDALRESGLANSVYKGGVLSHPNRGVKTLAESLCKQWSDAAPNKKPRCACMLLITLSFQKVFPFCTEHAACMLPCNTGLLSGRSGLGSKLPCPATAEPKQDVAYIVAVCSRHWLNYHWLHRHMLQLC